MGEVGLPELLLILVIALLVFGPRKLGELGKSLGEGLRGFKSAMSGEKEPEKPAEKPADSTTQAPSDSKKS